MEQYNGMEVAVIGMAARFPGASNIDEYWDNLIKGKESIKFFSEEELIENGVKEEVYKQPNYVNAYGVLKDKERFDASFFKYTDLEAEKMSPQMRVLHEVVWTGLEDAGYIPDQCNEKVGLYLSANASTYWEVVDSLAGNNEMFAGFSASTFLSKDQIATRISYRLNLHGPSVVLDTACSSSLVGVHLACQAILSGDCKMAVAGGISVSGSNNQGYLYQEGDIYSSDGHCCPFDENAKGTVRGDGGGVVILKALEDAIKDRDHIYAIIKGSAVNNDGNLKVGYTAPSMQGEIDVINSAINVSEIDKESVSYIETHGTATELGDTIEIEALKRVFGEGENTCYLGAVKANIGHLIQGAGIAGLIKTILCIRNRLIVGNIHYHKLNSKINFDNCKFVIPSENVAWKNAYPLHAGVSSYGIGGTNVHVILEEAPIEEKKVQEADSANVILMSANDKTALSDAKMNLRNYLLKEKENNLDEIAFMYQNNKKPFKYRTYFTYKTRKDLLEKLDHNHMIYCNETSRQICFMFTGQGTQYAGMGYGLYTKVPRFRELLKNCADIYERIEHRNLLDYVFGGDNERDINQTIFTQPVLFSMEYAMAKFLIELGVKPSCMIGHSVGEYVAACIAGVISLEEAMKLIICRAKLMQSLPKGSMLSVEITKEELEKIIIPGVSIAAINTSNKCVVSGTEDRISEMYEILKKEGYHTSLLNTSHAFHSSMMDPILNDFRMEVSKVTFYEPKINYISNLTGDYVTYEMISNPEYWVRHLRNTVLVEQGLRRLMEMAQDKWIFVEIGPGRTQGSFVVQHELYRKEKHVVYNSFRSKKESIEDNVQLMELLGKLWCLGESIHWKSLYCNRVMRKISVPSYSFQGKKYWYKKTLEELCGDTRLQVKNNVEKNKNLSDWFFIPEWERMPLQPSKIEKSVGNGYIVLFVNDSEFSKKMLDILGENNNVIEIHVSEQYFKFNEYKYGINPYYHDEYALLYKNICKQFTIQFVINLWGVEQEICNTIEEKEQFYTIQDKVFYPLIYTAKEISHYSPLAQYKIINVTTEVCDITGDENINSFYATSLGAIMSISQEFSNVTCKNIDTIYPLSEDENRRIVEMLYKEIMYKSIEHEVAYRNYKRYVKSYKQFPIVTEDKQEVFRQNGIYWITGGTGYIGTLVAEYLAKKYNAKILLISRRLFPYNDGDDLWSQSANSGDECKAYSDLINDRYGRGMIEYGLKKIREIGKNANYVEYPYEEFDNDVRQLCVSYIYTYFEQMGYLLNEKDRFSKTQLLDGLNIIPSMVKYFRLFLHILEQENCIRIVDEWIEVLTNRVDVRNEKELYAELKEKYIEFEGTLTLLDLCACNFQYVLNGKKQAVEVLFPNGNSSFIEGIMSLNKVEISNTITSFNVIAKLISQILAHTKKKIKILEVGGGSGQILNYLHPILQGKNVEYCFSDISENQIEQQREKAKQNKWNFINFRKIDISKDVYGQELNPLEYDIILGYNVVHATPDLRKTVLNLKKVLALNGYLFLLEDVKPREWLDMIWGYAKGWWSYTDEEIRKYSPITTISNWRDIFRDCGFEDICILPEEESKMIDVDVAIVIGKQNSTIKVEDISMFFPKYQDDISWIKKMRQKLSAINYKERQVYIKSVDMSDEEQMQELFVWSKKHLGELNGVIHAAGKTRDYLKTIEQFDMDREYCNQFFAPKVEGLLTLGKILKNQKIDFCVMMSSISSVLGGLGCAAYAAANNFLDAETARLNKNYDINCLSVNWGAWSNWSNNNKDNQTLGRIYNHIAMSSDEGIDALERVLSLEKTNQIVCYSGNLQQMHQCWLEELNDTSSVEVVETVETISEVKQEISRIWKEMFGRNDIGFDESFFEIGGDSLKAISIINILNKTLCIDISLTAFFKHPTINGLVDYIKEASENIQSLEIKPAEKKEYYVTSEIQKRMYALYAMNRLSTAYNESMVFILTGNVNIKKMQKAFIQVINMNECLRTTLFLKNGEVVQKISENFTFDLSVVKRPLLKNADDFLDEFIKPFDLEQDLMIRAIIIEKDEKEYILMIDMHHVVTDMISSRIFLDQLFEFYRDDSIATTSQIQYKDYCEWQKSPEYKKILESQEKYWISKYRDGVKRLSLPFDYLKESDNKGKGEILEGIFDSNLCIQLKDKAKEENVTLFQIMFTAYAILLSKICDQNEFCIGIPVIGRRNENLHNVMGMFVNTLAIKVDIDENKTLRTLLNSLKDECLECFENQEYDFANIVRNINYERCVGDNPIFNAMFVFLNEEEIKRVKLDDIVTKDIEIKPYTYRNTISKFDLAMTVKEEKDFLQLIFEYNGTRYKTSTIKRYMEYYRNILYTMINNLDILVSNIEVMSLSEKLMIRNVFNNTENKCSAYKTVTEVFKARVCEHPDKVAVISGENEITYYNLDIESNKVAHFLRNRGIRRNDNVGLSMVRSIEMIIGILGIIKAGGVYVPIDPSLPKSRRQYIAEDCNAKIVLTNIAEFYTEGDCIIDICDVMQHSVSEAVEDVNEPEDVCYIIYTSGSTGKPKGTMIEHRSIINQLVWMERKYKLGENHVILQKTTMSFDVSIWELFFWFYPNASIVILEQDEEKNPYSIIAAIEKYGVTALHFVPSMLNVFIDSVSVSEAQKSIRTLKYVYAGGESLIPSIVDKFYKVISYNGQKPILVNVYGPAETTITVTSLKCDENTKYEFVPIGKPIDNTKIYIVNKYNQEVPIGVIGEICVSGIAVGRGYINNELMTEEKFCENPFEKEKFYRTGDYGRWLEDGNIQFYGRRDNQVKIRGYRIELDEIENAMLQIKGVNEAAIVAILEDDGTKYLAGYYMSEPEFPVKNKEVREGLEELIPIYMVPKYIYQVDKLPRLNSGKIDRKKLMAVEIKNQEEAGEVVSVSKTEKVDLIKKVWSDVLKKADLSDNDNFFVIGGDSIKAIQIINMLRLHSVNAEVKDVFNYPTVAMFADRVKKKNKNNYEIVTGDMNLIPIQNKFFSNNITEQYNQAIMFRLKVKLSIVELTQLIKKLHAHHDVLRSTFVRDSKGEIIQRILNVDMEPYVKEVDLRKFSYSDKVMNDVMEATQINMNLAAGQLMKTVLFRNQNKDSIFIAMHHLITDGVSWRILIEDFTILLQQYLSHKELYLQSKTNSYLCWSEKLHEYAKSDILRSEIAYWRKIQDFGKKNRIYSNESISYQGEMENCVLQIRKEKTEQLSKRLNERINLDSIILALLGLAFSEVLGQKCFNIALEKHGREAIMDEVDVTRTVGWFTSIFPISMDMNQSSTEINMLIKNISECLHNVPNGGIGYGIIKYLTDELRGDDYIADICYNNIGDVDIEKQINSNLIELELENVKYSIGANVKREYKLEVVVSRKHDEIMIRLFYTKVQFEPDCMKKVLHQMQSYLEEFLASDKLMINDFDYNELSQEDLESLFD